MLSTKRWEVRGNMPAVAVLIEWLGAVIFRILLPFIWRNLAAVLTAGFLWLSTNKKFSEWFSEKITGLVLPKISDFLVFDSGFMSPSGLADAYAHINYLFPLNEMLSFLGGYLSLEAALFTYKLLKSSIKTASHIK